MSFHDSWIAIHGVTPEKVLEEFGLVESRAVGFPEVVGRPYALAMTDGGWTIIYATFNGLAHIENISGLSQHGMVLACDYQDQVDGGSSMLLAMRDGEKLWEIGAALDDLFIDGEPPPEFASIRDHYLAKSAEEPKACWMQEVPIELGKQLCGFRHDEGEIPFRGLLPRSDSRWHQNLKLAIHPKAQPLPQQGTPKWVIVLIVIVMLSALSPLLSGA